METTQKQVKSGKMDIKTNIWMDIMVGRIVNI